MERFAPEQVGTCAPAARSGCSGTSGTRAKGESTAENASLNAGQAFVNLSQAFVIVHRVSVHTSLASVIICNASLGQRRLDPSRHG